MPHRSTLVALVAAAVLAGCSMPKSGSDDATYYYSNKGASAVAPVRPMPTPVVNQAGPQGVARIVYFDFDKYEVKPQYLGVVQAHADYLRTRPQARVLIDWLQEAYIAGAKAVLLNAGGYTHTSIAIHDAIKSIKVPVIEVHLSDPMKREEFRHISYVGMAAVAHFAGHGADSYTLALDAAARL